MARHAQAGSSRLAQAGAPSLRVGPGPGTGPLARRHAPRPAAGLWRPRRSGLPVSRWATVAVPTARAAVTAADGLGDSNFDSAWADKLCRTPRLNRGGNQCPLPGTVEDMPVTVIAAGWSMRSMRAGLCDFGHFNRVISFSLLLVFK